ncbi:hypothetical protein TanjilG_32605 [Lupinus angustifolius]|uniref:CW-type domain-containing protein n=1 Tax=Lupinus angustifolius TaxID=3871 RepID=A0A4P1R8C3_LUPAN|nr:PREDICTED: B3 domain-containing transcription repressor VAL1-like isoform X1 [Lupinus angustifolius]XP_019455743.1 PREDICTED: B3 domain-containing transcription repressor VAL1-like isoform X1 [Lupinus angustifolius]OIW04413.1 hypothetical protein TanjilG_32605 [Lupinus angustifolius]
MESEVCMNGSCRGVGYEREWKQGWSLESGGFARLCNNCGSAYESSIFCEKFHREETGWRECSYCNKSIHCGCIVSLSLFKHLDFGGIGCVTCLKTSQHSLDIENPNVSLMSTKNNASNRHAAHKDDRLLVDSDDEGRLMQLCRIIQATESSQCPQAQRDGIVSRIDSISQEVKCSFREADARFSKLMKPSSHTLTSTSLGNSRPTWENKNMHDALALSMSLGTPSKNTVLPSATEKAEERVEGKESPPFHQGQRSHPILPKRPKTGLTMNLETNNGMISEARVPRPPAEYSGKHQLLPRYWPKITDQELEKLSTDLKSTVVPLFEKVLSASDAGRIGRLVLPKACAEAYFPHISHSEGIPLQFQDVKGNEWTLQFRFWPNNNSRMYVLEGVTPCIQSMQLNAGDTVTFSRIDPGDKFVLGFRRASSSIDTQDANASAQSNGISTKETVTAPTQNPQSRSNCPDLLSKKEIVEPHLNGHPEHLLLGTGGDKKCEMIKNDLLRQPISDSEKKRTRNIGPKSKRLLIHSEDAMELRLTWEEAQGLLHPPPSVKPNIVTIEDQEIEEYHEAPVIGKRTIFNASPTGRKEQWAHCDDCSKWRRVPVNVLLPKWTCSDNVWDASRSSCSAPEERSGMELDNLLRTSKVSKKRRRLEKSESVEEHEPSGLEALANAAVLGDILLDPAEPSSRVTTKHPRHRPGCTCIVCIQPPSGKGKHKPTCNCLACTTVKRRFKTLKMRKKKRQSEREADASASHKDQIQPMDEPDANGASKDDTSQLDEPSAAAHIDLNYDPNSEDMPVDDISGRSA